MLQVFPPVICGLFTRWLRPGALILGWIAGMAFGSGLAYSQGLKPVYDLVVGGAHYGIYIGLLALVLNLVVAIIATPIEAMVRSGSDTDCTRAEEYEDAVA